MSKQIEAMKPAQQDSPWCMKMNGCKTKCEDCPDEAPKIGCVNHDCDKCKAQQEPLTDIYRSFEQWKNGNVLEHGMPRTAYYSEAQLDLVEMGWKYGYDAGLAEQPAQEAELRRLHEVNQELLEALKAMVNDFDGCYADAEPSMINARAAIAKATKGNT